MIKNEFSDRAAAEKMFDAAVDASSQTIAKPHVKRSVWVVYPDSIRMGLSGENKPAAWFIHKHHAENYGQIMWERFYKVEQVEIHCV